MAVSRFAVFAIAALLGSGQTALATVGPETPAQAMDACCAPLFGKWRGKGWITRADGQRVDIDAEIEVMNSESGDSAIFIASYTPLESVEGKSTHRVALLTYVADGWKTTRDDPIAEVRYSSYRLRNLRGGPFWGARFVSGPGSPGFWVEPALGPGGGVIRYVLSTAETTMTLAGFCCSGGDEDRLSTFVLVTRVGPLGKPAQFWGWDP